MYVFSANLLIIDKYKIIVHCGVIHLYTAFPTGLKNRQISLLGSSAFVRSLICLFKGMLSSNTTPIYSLNSLTVAGGSDEFGIV